MNKFFVQKCGRAFFGFCVLGGLSVAAVCFYYALLDWEKLQKADAVFRGLSVAAPTNQIIMAEARQNVHRINIFAEGVWFLLGWILSTLGALGLSRTTDLLRQENRQ